MLFSAQLQCCLTTSWTELHMLLRHCLIHITIIILIHIFYSILFCPCQGLDLFTSYLCDLLFIINLIFIVINHITSLKQTHLFFVYFLGYHLLFLDDKVDEKKRKTFKYWKFSPTVLLNFCLIFCVFQPGVAFKSVAHKKRDITMIVI